MAARSGHAPLQEELRRTRRTVDRYVRRAVTLLDVSSLNAGALQAVPTPLRAADLVQNVLQAYRDEADYHGVCLDAEIVHDLAGSWDAHMLEEILANLVSNAIKYGNGSPVRVRVAAPAPGVAAFEVCDQGPGIAQADRQKIFEKFERVVARSGDRAGFGLGLWIVGRMVAAHRGTIEVIAGPTGGTVFRVLLPLQPRAPGDNPA